MSTRSAAKRRAAIEARRRAAAARPKTDRVVYSTECAWWDVVPLAAVASHGRCPGCGARTFSMGIQDWLSIHQDVEAKRPGWLTLVNGLRGRCLPTPELEEVTP